MTMQEDQFYEEVVEEITTGGNPQQGRQANPTQTNAQGGQQSQQPQRSGSAAPSQQAGSTGSTQQSQQSGGASQQPQATGIETDDHMVEDALKNGQPSNTISEWQRVHDKKYVEDITEKTEKH